MPVVGFQELYLGFSCNFIGLCSHSLALQYSLALRSYSFTFRSDLLARQSNSFTFRSDLLALRSHSLAFFKPHPNEN